MPVDKTRKSNRDAGDGLVTLFASHVTVLHDMREKKENETRTTAKHRAPRPRSKSHRNDVQLGTAGETGSGWEFFAESCWRPMPQEG